MHFSKLVLSALAFLAVSSAAPADVLHAGSTDVGLTGVAKTSDAVVGNSDLLARLTTSPVNSGLVTRDEDTGLVILELTFEIDAKIIIVRSPCPTNQCLSLQTISRGLGFTKDACTGLRSVDARFTLIYSSDLTCSIGFITFSVNTTVALTIISKSS
ncbi:hypothetical protein B0H19DRAFT_1383383 [Mycena capillaripes]|nr:hypothetical protein B0H19DRAFT_1383383 [Mycena capillaripes]